MRATCVDHGLTTFVFDTRGIHHDRAQVMTDAAGFIVPEGQADLLGQSGNVNQRPGRKAPMRGIIFVSLSVIFEDRRFVEIRIEGNG